MTRNNFQCCHVNQCFQLYREGTNAIFNTLNLLNQRVLKTETKTIRACDFLLKGEALFSFA